MEMGKASEQATSSWTPLKKNEEIHGEGYALQMKIDAMQEEIEKLKVANPVNRPTQESQRMGTSMWKVLFYAFVGWLVYNLYTSLYTSSGKGNHLALVNFKLKHCTFVCRLSFCSEF